MFNVGDIVVVTDGSNYTFTKTGSYGVVVGATRYTTIIDFQFTPSGNCDIWSISNEYLALKVAVPKEVLIENKIATIYSRQRARGIAHV